MGEYASWVENFRDDIARELDRITTRLTGLNGERLEYSATLVHGCAAKILSMTRNAGENNENRPSELPLVGSTAAAAQLTVVTRDYLDCAPSSNQECHEVLDALTQLRRALP